MDLAHRRLTSDFFFSGGGMNCASYDICVYNFCGFYIFSLEYSSSPE